MKRRYGLGHYQRPPFQRKPVPASLRRLGIVFLIGAGVAIVASWPAPAQTVTCNQLGCSDNPGVKRTAKQSRSFSARRHDANGNGTRTLIGSRPAGCPYKYCGCGLARYLGIDDKRLHRAWAWAEIFPRTHARPGAVAVRRHHVMMLERHVGGSRWLVRSYNDYLRKSWLVVRSVSGFIFVDPATRIATK